MTIEHFCNQVEILIYGFKPTDAPDEQGEISWEVDSNGYSMKLVVPKEWFEKS